MKKYILLFKDTQNNRAAFVERITLQVVPHLRRQSPNDLKLTITRTAPPRISIIPFSKTAVSCLSMKAHQIDLSGYTTDPFFYGAYEVTEALPVRYTLDWPPNAPTPGACLLTLFNRKKNQTDEQFFHRWHNGHTPLSLKIHPLWNYNRNAVVKTLGGTPFEGIVEEQVREGSELLNPMRFFGGPLMMGVNMIRTFIDTKSFIDYGTMETYFAEETWLIRP
ncbi:MAG: hypothetical protein JXX29_12540 [Deltaproteobacteria bacterium]|nr:hypothetical protein [Deltaproteobacteria bacterium]MBN2672503.1 hypothetical protein [Deltaproteobacteria bacterium]